MFVEVTEVHLHERCPREDSRQRQHDRQEHEQPEERIPDLAEAEAELRPEVQARPVAAANPEHHVHHAARPLELLGQTILQAIRAVTVSFGVDRKDAMPAM